MTMVRTQTLVLEHRERWEPAVLEHSRKQKMETPFIKKRMFRDWSGELKKTKLTE